jgi:hypothetical protein
MTEIDKDDLIEKLRAAKRRWKIAAISTSSVLGLLLLLSSATVAIQLRQANQARMEAIAARDAAHAAVIQAQEAMQNTADEEP